MKIIKSFTSTLVSLLLLSGCHGCKPKGQEMEKKSIKVGVIAGPETLLMEKIKDIAESEEGLIIEIIQFNDYMTPNIALHDKSIDANSFQHEPYLNEMVRSRGFKLVAAGPTFIYPLAAYSKKIRHAKDLAFNAKVAIPNDPTNESRALRLLEKQGLIELKAGKGHLYQASDIIKNPMDLKLVELEAAQLPRALDDVDIAIINTTFASAAGLNPQHDGLFMEGADSPYVNIVAVREEDKDADWVKKLMKAIHHDKVKQAALEIFKGSVLPGWRTEGTGDGGLKDD